MCKEWHPEALKCKTTSKGRAQDILLKFPEWFVVIKILRRHSLPSNLLNTYLMCMLIIDIILYGFPVETWTSIYSPKMGGRCTKEIIPPLSSLMTQWDLETYLQEHSWCVAWRSMNVSKAAILLSPSWTRIHESEHLEFSTHHADNYIEKSLAQRLSLPFISSEKCMT